MEAKKIKNVMFQDQYQYNKCILINKKMSACQFILFYFFAVQCLGIASMRIKC